MYENPGYGGPGNGNLADDGPGNEYYAGDGQKNEYYAAGGGPRNGNHASDGPGNGNHAAGGPGNGNPGRGDWENANGAGLESEWSYSLDSPCRRYPLPCLCYWWARRCVSPSPQRRTGPRCI